MWYGSTLRPERRRTAYLRRSISRTHHSASARAALASGSLKKWIQAVFDDVQCTQRSLPFVPLRHVAAGRYTITSTSSALRRLVELRQAATSDEIRRTGVFTFWSSLMESTSRAHQTTVVSLFSSENLKQSCSHVVSRSPSSHTYIVMHPCSWL